MYNSKIVPIDELLPDPTNARKHPEQNKRVTQASLRRFGAARSIVVDGKNIVLAGSATLEAARAEGVKEVQLIESDGKRLIAVQRKDLEGSAGTGYALVDNRANDLSYFDPEVFPDQLDALALEGFDLSDLGWATDQRDLSLDPADIQIVDEDEVSRLDEKTKLKCPECGHEFEA